MSRIKLKTPKKYHFSTLLTLRIYDMNYGAHMGNDAILRIVHEARVQFLESLNLKEIDFYGFSLLMSDSAVVYKKQAFYGDKLGIEIAVSKLNDYGFDLFYLIKTNNLEIARVKTGMVCYSNEKNKIQKIPVDFVNHFS